VLKLHQTGIGTDPTPIPAPKPVVHPYSAFLDEGLLAERWGKPRRVYLNGRVALDPQGAPKHYRWNPRWAPCSAWLHRARTEHEFPTAGDWQSLPTQPGGPASMIPFSNGWLLLRFNDQGWRWA
jgi:hypothetical protein